MTKSTPPTVWVSMLVGLVLMVLFVLHSFRPEHPLLDLRLFKNRNLTVSIITMFLFAAAFFGGLLLVPTYFQEVRGESTLQAGLLVAPQGIGAMITMPIAGSQVVAHGLRFTAEETAGRRNKIGIVRISRVEPEPQTVHDPSAKPASKPEKLACSLRCGRVFDVLLSPPWTPRAF